MTQFEPGQQVACGCGNSGVVINDSGARSIQVIWDSSLDQKISYVDRSHVSPWDGNKAYCEKHRVELPNPMVICELCEWQANAPYASCHCGRPCVAYKDYCQACLYTRCWTVTGLLPICYIGMVE